MYGKHYERMYQGSMRGAGSDVFAVWGYVISHVKLDSLVELNPEIIAFLIGMPQDRVEKAIAWLEAPDPKSRNPDHEGRRLLKRGEFEFYVPSAAFYRGVKSPDDLREYNRIKKRESRARLMEQPIGNDSVAEPNRTIVNGFIPTEDHVKEWLLKAKTNGADYRLDEAMRAYLHLKALGFMKGKAPITDWRAGLEDRIQQQRHWDSQDATKQQPEKNKPIKFQV